MRTALIVLCFLLTTAVAYAGPASPELRAAIAAKDAATVTSLLSQGDDPNGTWMHDGVGLAPVLFAALDTQDVAVLKALLEGGADPNLKRNGDSSSPLTYAAARGYPDAVTALLEHGADANYHLPTGASALGFAAAYGKVDVCRILLDHGVPVDQVMGDGNDPLGYACGHKQLETPLLLLERGADPLKQLGDDDDPWSMALREGLTPVVIAMLDLGVAPTQNSWIQNGICRSAIVVAASFGHVEIVKALVARGADPFGKSTNNTSPIGEAVWFQHPAMVEWLLDQGADPNWVQRPDVTLLIICVKNDNLEILNLLVDRGADITQVRTSDGLSPWAVAAVEGRPRITRRLLELGVDPETIVEEHTALWRYAWAGNVEGVQVLIEGKAKMDLKHPQWGTTPLWEAQRKGHVEVVTALLEGGADPNITREGFDPVNRYAGIPPLTDAIATRKIDIALILLEHGADPNATAIDYYPPLYMALQSERLDLFKSLLDHGADPNTSYKWGPMLLWCIKQERTEMAMALLEHDANPNTQSVASDWWTPLMLASYIRNIEVVEALIQHGADALIRSSVGRRALDVALDGGDPEVIKLITAVTEQQEKLLEEKRKQEEGPHTPVYRE